MLVWVYIHERLPAIQVYRQLRIVANVDTQAKVTLAVAPNAAFMKHSYICNVM
jgi:hypothetical protein